MQFWGRFVKLTSVLKNMRKFWY